MAERAFNGYQVLARTITRQRAEAVGASPRQVEYACDLAERYVRQDQGIGCAVERALTEARIKPCQPHDYDPIEGVVRLPRRPFPTARWVLALGLTWFVFAVWAWW